MLDESQAAGLVERLRRYARGEDVSFEDFRCDLAESTPFQRSVLEVVQKIPWGQTWSYADVARAVGRNRTLPARWARLWPATRYP